jgi:hypothetical protein
VQASFMETLIRYNERAITTAQVRPPLQPKAR